MHDANPFHTSSVYSDGAHIPRDSDIRQATAILNNSKRVAILVGRGALGSTIEVEDLAERLGAPVIKALLGKAVLPDDSPYTTGTVGILGTNPSNQALKECGTLLIVGSTFPYMNYLPEPGKARGIQIDIDPTRIGLRYPVEVGIVGDSRESLRRLIPLLARNDDRSFLQTAQNRMAEWWKAMEEEASNRHIPMKPQALAWELGKRLDPYAIVSTDCGINTYFWAKQIRVQRGQMFSVSGMLASMAGGLPYTLAAQMAYPDRQCVAFIGDGGFSMLMADFVTAVKYDLPVKIFVIKNNVLAQIKWEQLMFLGNPEYGVDLAPIDYAEFARACGGQGFHVEDPKECGEVVQKALETEGPVIVEAVVDPLEPMLPPELGEQFRTRFEKAFVRGEPDRDAIMRIIERRKQELVKT